MNKKNNFHVLLIYGPYVSFICNLQTTEKSKKIKKLLMIKKYIFPHIKKFLPQKIIEIIKISIYVILDKHSRREWLLNEIYFYYFIYRHKIIYHYKVELNELEVNTNKIIKKYSNSVHHAPFFRAKKLLNKIPNDNSYHFLDVGSGLGILLFFVSINYNFKSYTGIEINNDIYKHSVKNCKKLNLKKTFIQNISADKFILDEKKYIIYFYNPFKNFILEKFLQNNFKIIKKTNSIILFHNDKTGNIFQKYGFAKICVDDGLNLYFIMK